MFSERLQIVFTGYQSWAKNHAPHFGFSPAQSIPYILGFEPQATTSRLGHCATLLVIRHGVMARRAAKSDKQLRTVHNEKILNQEQKVAKKLQSASVLLSSSSPCPIPVVYLDVTQNFVTFSSRHLPSRAYF